MPSREVTPLIWLDLRCTDSKILSKLCLKRSHPSFSLQTCMRGLLYLFLVKKKNWKKVAINRRTQNFVFIVDMEYIFILHSNTFHFCLLILFLAQIFCYSFEACRNKSVFLKFEGPSWLWSYGSWICEFESTWINIMS
jgi:hypothetical protein